MICPYCESQKAVVVDRTYPFTYDVQCDSPRCSSQWHQGIYKVAVLVVLKQEKRGLGRDRPTIYTIRFRTDQGGEDLFVFRTLHKGLSLKKGDAIALGFKKKGQGIFLKTWTGEWEGSPSIFCNLTINTYYKV